MDAFRAQLVRQAFLDSHSQRDKLIKAISEGRSNLYIPSVGQFLENTSSLLIDAAFAYWLLLYDRLVFRVEYVSDIIRLASVVGRDNFTELAHNQRLAFAFDPPVCSSHDPAFGPLRGYHFGEKIDYFGVGYGGTNFDEGVKSFCWQYLLDCNKHLDDDSLRRATVENLFPASPEVPNDGTGFDFMEKVNQELKRRLVRTFRGNHTAIEEFVLNEGNALACLANLLREVRICQMMNLDIDLKCIELLFSKQAEKRLRRYMPEDQSLSSDFLDRKKCINAVRKILGCPNIYMSLRNKRRTLDDYIKLTMETSAKGFREWVRDNVKGKHENNIETEFVNHLIDLVKITGRSNWLGWAAQNVIGAVPIVGSLLAATWSATDEMRRDVVGKWDPMLFASKMSDMS